MPETRRLQVESLRLQRLAAREREQPLRQLRGAAGALQSRTRAASSAVDELGELGAARPTLASWRFMVSRLPMMMVSRLLKSWAMPPVSWPTASIFCAWRKRVLGLAAQLRIRRRARGCRSKQALEAHGGVETARTARQDDRRQQRHADQTPPGCNVWSARARPGARAADRCSVWKKPMRSRPGCRPSARGHWAELIDRERDVALALPGQARRILSWSLALIRGLEREYVSSPECDVVGRPVQAVERSAAS